MSTRRASGTRSEVIHCPNCGEDYSITYKRCPFCDERARAAEEAFQLSEEELEGKTVPTRLAKRRSGFRRGGGYGGPQSPLRTGLTIVSLAIIVAAVWIVFSYVGPLIDRGNVKTTPPPSATPPAATTSPTPAPTPEGEDPGAVVDPTVTEPMGEPTPTPTPAPTPAAIPTPKPGSTAFTLNHSDFTMNGPGDPTVTMKATGAVGAVTWSVENPVIATIDANGEVTAVSKGLTNIIAVASDGAVTTCIVRVRTGTPPAASTQAPVAPTQAPAATPAPTQAPATPKPTAVPTQTPATPKPTVAPTQAPAATELKLNREDFSFTSQDSPSFTMKVTGATGTPVWSIDKPAVATIDAATGKVTPVARGTATITCKVDGQTLTCIVRCQFS